jgi:hypothetical protein
MVCTKRAQQNVAYKPYLLCALTINLGANVNQSAYRISWLHSAQP